MSSGQWPVSVCWAARLCAANCGPSAPTETLARLAETDARRPVGGRGICQHAFRPAGRRGPSSWAAKLLRPNQFEAPLKLQLKLELGLHLELHLGLHLGRHSPLGAQTGRQLIAWRQALLSAPKLTRLSGRG